MKNMIIQRRTQIATSTNKFCFCFMWNNRFKIRMEAIGPYTPYHSSNR